MTDGYIYCFSNISMPGLLKIGMTKRTPKVRLSEANATETYRPPTPYKIEFAKKVSNPFQKERTLHTLLEKYTKRIATRKEFFRVSPEEVHKFFDLMDGEMWEETCEEKKSDEEVTENITMVLREPEIDITSANNCVEKNDTFMHFFSESFIKEDGAVPVDAKIVRSQFRNWKKANAGLHVDLKEPQVFERMRILCGQDSTHNIFCGIRVSDDLSGSNFVAHMP